jgi:glutamate 5-kinase
VPVSSSIFRAGTTEMARRNGKAKKEWLAKEVAKIVNTGKELGVKFDLVTSGSQFIGDFVKKIARHPPLLKL